MMTCEESRKFFPYLNTGLKYFNHASIGPLSSRVKEKLDEYILQRSEIFVENYFETLPQANSAKKRVAKLLNVEKKNIAWTDSVSNALNLLAQGLKWKRGDQIVLNDLEFPSNIYPFLNLREKGVEILFAKSKNGKVDLDEIEKIITPRTKLISISMVQFLTGYRADLRQIGDYCKHNDILFCVDGIQGAGVVTVDPLDLGIDFFAGGTQKWLMGLQGTSYFYISQKLHEKITPKYVGWTSVKDAWNLTEYNLELLESAERYQNGTMSRIGLIAIEASLSLFEEIGYSNTEKQILDNTEYLIGQLMENGFDPILKNLSRKKLSGIVTFEHQEAENIVENLKRKKIICSLRQGMVRLAPHFYNNKEDLDILVYHLKESITKK